VLATAAATGESTAMAADATEPSGDTLQEILVTAQKRTESSQNVPISLTAIDSAAIEQSHARDIQGIAKLAPNLIIDPILGNGTAAISIRGMQLNDVEKSFDPAVAVYLDGIYLANTTGALLQLFDASDIEVLRGPQGTLFGRNTIGGLLSINRAKPTDDFGGHVSVTYARFDELDVNAAVNFGSMLDGKVKSKIALLSQTGGGYFTNVSTNPALYGQREGNTDFQGYTWATTFLPIDTIEANLTVDYFNDHTPTRPVTSITGPLETFCGVYGANCGEPASDIGYHSDTHTVQPQPAYLHTKAVTLNVKWQALENQKVVSLTGYRGSNENAIQEFDGGSTLPGSPAFPGGTPVFITARPTWEDQISEELRLESDWNKVVRSTFGLYYFDTAYHIQQNTFIFGIDNNSPYFRQVTESKAAYGQVDWDFVPDWTLSLGGRYIDEKKDACGTADQFVAPTSYISYGTCDVPGTVYQGSYVDPSTGATVSQNGKASWEKFTPRANLQWRFENGKMAYVTYSEGFRSGGFNGRSTDVNTLGPYEPEIVKAIEIGLKSQWFDNTLRFNIDAFHNKYINKQEDVVFPAGVDSTVTLVENAGKAHMWGGEAELTWLPIHGLKTELNIGLLDAQYDSFLVPGLSGGTVNKDEFSLRRAPHFTGSFNVEYQETVGPGAVTYDANYAYKSKYYVVAETLSPYTVDPQGAFNSNPGLIHSFGDLDLSVSYDLSNYRVSVWGKNMTDERHFLHVLDVGTNYNAGPNGQPIPVPGLWTFGTLNPPRTFGVSLSMKF